MSQRRIHRDHRRQLGKFYTPAGLAKTIISSIELRDGMKILEPSAGEGVFVGALIQKAQDTRVSLEITAVELDSAAAAVCRDRYGRLAKIHAEDFYHWIPEGIICHARGSRPSLPSPRPSAKPSPLTTRVLNR